MRMPSLEMPAEIKRDWLIALRSGEYEQAEGTLYDGAGGYCCLGVLQMVVDGKVEEACHGPLSQPTNEWYRENEMDSFYRSSSRRRNPGHDFLIRMNDEGIWDDNTFEQNRFSFLEIADWIEENVEGV